MRPNELAVLTGFANTSDEPIMDAAARLAADGLLLAGSGEQNGYVVTERGRAFIDHVCSLPLPEQVTIWAVGSTPSPVAPRGVSMADLREAGFTGTGPNGEGAPPAPAAPASRLPRIEIPTDPAEVRRLAVQYMNNGMGVGETAEILGITFDEADAYFLGK